MMKDRLDLELAFNAASHQYASKLIFTLLLDIRDLLLEQKAERERELWPNSPGAMPGPTVPEWEIVTEVGPLVEADWQYLLLTDARLDGFESAHDYDNQPGYWLPADHSKVLDCYDLETVIGTEVSVEDVKYGWWRRPKRKESK